MSLKALTTDLTWNGNKSTSCYSLSVIYSFPINNSVKGTKSDTEIVVYCSRRQWMKAIYRGLKFPFHKIKNAEKLWKRRWKFIVVSCFFVGVRLDARRERRSNRNFSPWICKLFFSELNYKFSLKACSAKKLVIDV